MEGEVETAGPTVCDEGRKPPPKGGDIVLPSTASSRRPGPNRHASSQGTGGPMLSAGPGTVEPDSVRGRAGAVDGDALQRAPPMRRMSRTGLTLAGPRSARTWQGSSGR